MVSGSNPELLERPYWTDYKPFRLSLHNLITSKYFEWEYFYSFTKQYSMKYCLFISLAISAVIGLNVITMAMEYYMMPPVR